MKKQFWIPIAAVLMMVAASASAFADLTAAQVAAHFNGMNANAQNPNGRGFVFASTAQGGTFTTATGTQQVEINAYSTNPVRAGVTQGLNYFMTFCAAPSLGSVGSSGTAKLNYDAATGRSWNTATGTNAAFLSVGAAYLYKQYATGAIASPGSTLLDQLNRQVAGTLDWNGNSFLRSLLDINSSKDFWMGNYDARVDYTFMNGYYTFIMDVRDGSGVSKQDMYYLANKATYNGGGNGGDGVPEPATLLFWTLGIGAVGFGQYRKRSKKA